MAKIKYDVTNVEDQADFVQAKPGMYIARIDGVEVGESKAGQPMLTLKLEIIKDSKGKKVKENYGRVWHRVPLDDTNPGWTPRLKEFIKAIGLKPKGQLDPDKLEGILVQIRVAADKDLDGEYRAQVGKMLAMPDDADDADDDDDDDEVDDTDTDDDDDDDDDDDEDDDEPWDEDTLGELSNKELKEVAAEFLDDDDVPAKLTAKSKPKLIEAILEAQGEDDEDDDGDDEDDDEYDEDSLGELDDDDLIEVATDEFDLDKPKGKLTSAKRKKLIAAILEAQEEADDEDDDDDDSDDDDDETEDYSDWSRSQLIKEARSRGLKVKKTDDEDTIREWLVAADAEGDDDDEDEDDEDYAEWDLPDLKNELKERGLKTSGSKKILVARLEKSDEDDDGDPF